MFKNLDTKTCPFSGSMCLSEPCILAENQTCMLASLVREQVSALRTKRERANAKYVAVANKIRNACCDCGDALVDYAEGLMLPDEQLSTLIALIWAFASQIASEVSYQSTLETLEDEKRAKAHLGKIASNKSFAKIASPLCATPSKPRPFPYGDEDLPF